MERLFTGFPSPTEAAWAAWEAFRRLEFARTGRLIRNDGAGPVTLELGNPPRVVVAGRGVIARLVPPADPARRFDEWGFAMDLARDGHRTGTTAWPSLPAEVRRMWRGVRNAGLALRS